MLVAVLKQFPLEFQQLYTYCCADVLPCGDCDQVTLQIVPTQLAMLNRDVVLDRDAITHHSSAKGLLDSSIAAAVERPRVFRDTVTTGVTMTHSQAFLLTVLLRFVLPVDVPVSSTLATGC
jgi:hypothetical protein